MRHQEITKHKEQQAAYLTNEKKLRLLSDDKQTEKPNIAKNRFLKKHTQKTKRVFEKRSRCPNATSR